MRLRTIAGLGLAGAALLAACGGGHGSYSQPASPGTTTTSPTTAVKVSSSSLGNVLVNADGRTLYGFTNDANGTSTCVGSCAQNWPPVRVAAGWKAAAATAGDKFHTIKRADGQLQLAVGKWPLYTFSGDSAPGDVNGQGTLGKWFVVRPDGTLLKDVSFATTTTTSPAAMSGIGY